MDNNHPKTHYIYDENLRQSLINLECPYCTTRTILDNEDNTYTVTHTPSELKLTNTHDGSNRSCTRCDLTVIGNPTNISYQIHKSPPTEDTNQEYGRCPECGKHDIIFDYNRWERYCSACGLVVDGIMHTTRNGDGETVWVDYPHKNSIHLLIESGDIIIPGDNTHYYSRRGRI